jgi:hypothetical protein
MSVIIPAGRGVMLGLGLVGPERAAPEPNIARRHRDDRHIFGRGHAA